MKLFAMILCSIFLGKSCEGQNKKDLKTAVLEYTANTRGFYQKITIQDKVVSISKDRSGTEKPLSTPISEADWKELVGFFDNVNLDHLATVKAPTKKRFHDGAAIANLEVTYKDKSYKTTSFDHGNPPEEIKKLVSKINSFAKKNDEH